MALGLIGLEILARVYPKKAGAFFRAEFSRNSDLVLQPFETTISVWEHFPRVTFTFKNISILDTTRATPLQVLAIKQAVVAVPISQFRLDRIKIRRVVLDHVFFQQRTDSLGNKVSLRFRPRKNPDTGSNKTPFIIRELILRDARLVSENHYKKSAFTLTIVRADLAAALIQGQLNLKGRLNGKIGLIRSKKRSLYQNQAFTANVQYIYRAKQKKGVIYNTQAILNGNLIQVRGWHRRQVSGNDGSWLDIKLSGYQPLAYLLPQLMPIRTQSLLARVKTTSRLLLTYHITGYNSPRQRPRSRLTFQLANGELFLPTNKRFIWDVNLRGELEQGGRYDPQTSRFAISNLSARTGQGNIRLQMQITNFSRPSFTINAQGRMNLPDLAALVPLPLTIVTQGTVSGNFRLSGNIRDSSQPAPAVWRGQGKLQLHNATFRPVGLAVNCRAVNGNLLLTDRTLHLQQLSGKIGGQHFKLQASVSNYFTYLFGLPGTVKARVNIIAEQFDTDWLSAPLMAASKKAEPMVTGTTPPLPALHKTNSQTGALPLRKRTKELPDITGYPESRALLIPTPLAHRQNWWKGVQAQVHVKVGIVKLPGRVRFKNLTVLVNQHGQQVKLTRMRFTTSEGGLATANGGFRLTAAGIVEPLLTVNLLYPSLDLQTFMQDVASLKGLTQSPALPASSAASRQKYIYFKENTYRVNLLVKAQKLRYQYLNGSDLVLAANMNPQRVKLTTLRVRAFGGTINARGNLQIDAPTNSYPVRLRAQIEDVDLQQLFTIADGMQLDVLSSRNIRGIANCNLTVSTALDSTFAPGFEGTIAYAKASFRKMELLEVAPIQYALRFLRKERTEHLYFEEVKTHFVLKDRQFITPGLRLNSNLTAFELSGTYTMQGPAHINMDINIFNVLFGNNKRRIERIQADSVTSQNKLKHHLLLIREQDKYKVKLRNRKEREASALALQSEFQQLLQRHQIDTVFTRNQSGL